MARWCRWTAAATRRSTRSSTPTTPRTSTTPGSPPTTSRSYLGPWSQLLQEKGGRTPEDARAAALTVLPDVLHYDRTQHATYPNGRLLTDDVYSERFAWLTNGHVGPDGLKPHDDLQAQFPYLGLPN